MKLGLIAKLAALVLQISTLYSILSLWLDGLFRIGVILFGSILSATLVVLYFSLSSAVGAAREYRRDPQKGFVQLGIALLVLASVYYAITRYTTISESIPMIRLENLRGDTFLGVSALVIALSALVIARDFAFQLLMSLRMNVLSFRSREEGEDDVIDVY